MVNIKEGLELPEEFKEHRAQPEQPELSEEEKAKIQQNAQLLSAFQANLQEFDRISATMTSRQMARVVRSLMKAPFIGHEKFIDKKEELLYSLGMRIMDVKMLLVMEHQKQIESGLKEVHEKAKQAETKGEE